MKKHLIFYYYYYYNIFMVTDWLPCEQRLHFRCVSCHGKSSLCQKPFKSVQKSGWINLKNWFFPVLGRFKSLRESCMSLMSQVRVDAIFLFLQNSPIDNRSDYWFSLRIAWQILHMHNRKLNGCQQRLLFACQLTQGKCSLCLKGTDWLNQHR